MASVLRVASAEKVMFHDEITGCEMWRISSIAMFHGYSATGRPFSEEGQWAASSAFGDRAIAVFDMADGREAIIGRESPGRKRPPLFLHRSGRRALIYNCEVYDREAGRAEVMLYLYDLDSHTGRCVARLPKRFCTLFGGVIGPASEYVQLQGDLTGDGLSDWGVKSIWTDEPPRVVLSRPDADVFVYVQSPSLTQPNRTALNMTILDPRIVREAKSAANSQASYHNHRPDSRFEAYIADLDMETFKPTVYPVRGVRRWSHRTWTGDGGQIYMHYYAWQLDRAKPSAPIRIGELPMCDHYGPCGGTGRYVVGDHLPNGMEEIWMLDVWTGEWHTRTHVSVTNNEKGHQLDRAHAMGSPDGTKVLIRSCYEHVNHRHFAVPTRDVSPGDAVIPVETTKGFPARGALLYGFPHRIEIMYERKDETHFYGCDWAADPQKRFSEAVAELSRRYGPIPNIPRGSHYLTSALGRHFPSGVVRPPKGYIVVVKRPDPPRSLVAEPTDKGDQVRLTWRPPISHREVAGYVVCRQVGNRPLTRLTPKPIVGREYLDANPPQQGKATYLVRTVEHSGLYGAWSGLARIDGQNANVTLLDSYDVRGCNFMAPDERVVEDRRQVRVHVPVTGDCVLWARGRAYEEAEAIQVLVNGEPSASARIEGNKWHWSRLASCRLTAGEHVVELAREETLPVREGNLLSNAGFEEGVTGWAVDESVMSVDRVRPHSGKQCLKLSGNLTGKLVTQTLALTLRPEWSYRVSFWVRGKFSKGRKRYPANQTHVGYIHSHVHGFPTGSTYYTHAAEFDDGDWHQFHLWLHTEPHKPGQEPAKEVVVQPFKCLWGEHVGTLWLDDVEFVDLGPRLRPVKVTKLLVTNIRDYEPTGLDGRDAYRFPESPPIPVAGLRETGRTPNSITLAWEAARPGTRGYNVYLAQGEQCPATKYYLRTSVWDRTSVTLDALVSDTTYTVKVAAIDEDGGIGPAASVRARTGRRSVEPIVLKPQHAALIGPMAVQQTDSRTFLTTPRKPEHKRPLMEGVSAEQAGAARFDFVVKTPGNYAIWGLMCAPKRLDNALWFSLDDGPERLWRLSKRSVGHWCWHAPADEPWALEAGKHTITVRTCQPGTRLARILVTTDLVDMSNLHP